MTSPPSSGAQPPQPPQSPSPQPSSRRQVQFTTGEVVRVLAIITATFLAVRLMWFARPVLFVLFLGVLFALPLASAADRLEKRGVKRWVSVSAILTIFCGLLVGGSVMMAPILRVQSAELRQRLPEATDKIDAWLGVHANGLATFIISPAEALDSVKASAVDSVVLRDSVPVSVVLADSATRARVVVAGSNLRRQITQQFSGAQRSFLGVLRSTFAVGAGVLLVLFVAGYIGADPMLYHGLLLEMVPAEKRPHTALTLRRVGTTLRQWLTMQLIAMVVIGGVTTAFLFAIQVKAALPLGIIAGLLKFIPIIGSFVAAVPAVAMAFIDSPHKAMLVIVGYVIIQLVENHVLIPMLMKAGVNIPPALTLGMQALMSVLFGFLGLLLAVPLLAAIMTTFRTINAGEMRALSRNVSTAAPPPTPL